MHISFEKKILKFKQPAGTSRGVYRTRTLWYVTARDNEGNWGIGECAPLPDLSCDAMSDDQYEMVLADACKRVESTGSTPKEILEALSTAEAMGMRNTPSILFGIETAMLSLEACRTKGTPYQLFDNKFSRGEKGTRINGLVWMGTYEEMMNRMEEKLALGFRCIKIKIGAIDWEREINLIQALRERFPKEKVEIRVDANGGFSPQIAMKRLEELSRYDIHSIEQPICQNQWEEMARLCRETPIPIALDEELIGVNTPAEKARLLDTIRPQYIILKPSLHGGLSGSAEWISLAEERGIGHWVTSALESNVGLNVIAQWTAEGEKRITQSADLRNEKECVGFLPKNDLIPQGLGTGQLFEQNYNAIHLSIEGERLWFGSPEERSFEADYNTFLKEWKDTATTICVHTSGSTGEPKEILVEKSRMKASARMTLEYLQIPKGETALLCMPLRYIAGKMMVVRAIEGQLRLIRQKPSGTPDLSVVPLPYFLAVTPMQAVNLLRDSLQRPIFERIPRIIIGGGSISAELHTELQNCKGQVFSTYGMTETLSHIAMRRLNGTEQSEWYTPLKGVKISQSEEGCLVIEAPMVNAETLITNDLCELNPNGNFKILGRKDNIICSGGIKLSLEAIEEKIGYIGIPYQLTAVTDPVLGEALTMLYSGPKPDENEIRKRINRFEMPKHFIFAEKLPKTETGKPARKEIRELAHFLFSKICDFK